MRKKIITIAVSVGMVLSTLVSAQTVIASPSATSIKLASPKVRILPNNPTSIDAADLDGDGKLDAVIGYAQGNQAGILKGNNDGTFVAESVVSVNMIAPTQMIAENASGTIGGSLIAASQQSSKISIHREYNNKIFKEWDAITFIPALGGLSCLAAGDFDADTFLDLAVLLGNSKIMVLKKVTQNHPMIFEDVLTGGSGGLVRKIVSGDFNEDGKADLAGVNASDDIAILTSTSTDTFMSFTAPAVTYQSGGDMVVDMIAGDFNGDGHLDLAAANASSKNIGILLGNGDGTFNTPLIYPLLDTPRKIQQGDFDRDGCIDLVVVTDNNVSIIPGNGNGTFSNQEIFITGTQLNDAVVKDLNGDGFVDLMVSDYAANSISVLLNNTMDIAAAALSDGTIDIPYSESVSATGGTLPYTWSASGLPEGLGIDAATGQISGIPAVTTTSVIHITVSDSRGLSVSKDLSLTVNPVGLCISTNNLPAGIIGVSYSGVMRASGGILPYSWISSGLPEGLSIDPSTGEIYGVPRVTTTSVISITVTDHSGISASKDLTLTINSAAPSGGGSSGGGSSSLPSPAIVPVEPDTLVEIITTENSTTAFTIIKPQIDANGQGLVSITEKQIKDLIKKLTEQSSAGKENQRKVIEIKIAVSEKKTKVVFSIPKSAIKLILKNSQDAFKITYPEVTLLFDKEALNAIERQAEGEVKIGIESVDLDTLTPEQQAKIAGRPVFSFTVKSGSKMITSFGNGRVRVSIPYILKPGEDPSKIIIYHINEKGELVKVPNCTYDALTGMMYFTTNHFSVYGIGYSDVSFTDVSGIYTENIHYLAARGIMNGRKKNLFMPQGTITRAEFVQLLANIAGADLDQYTDTSFADVKSGDWYCKAAAWAYEKGIIGDTETILRPKEAITRQDMALMLSLYAHKIENYALPVIKEPVKFADNSNIADYAKTAVLEMQQAGIISGRDNNLFDPKAAVSRAETAKMITGLIKGMINSKSFY